MTTDLDAAIAAQGAQFRTQLSKGACLLSHKPAKLFHPRTRPVRVYVSHDLHYLYFAKQVTSHTAPTNARKDPTRNDDTITSIPSTPSTTLTSPTSIQEISPTINATPSKHGTSSITPPGPVASPSPSPASTSLLSSSSSPATPAKVSSTSPPTSLLAVRGVAPLSIDGNAGTPSPNRSASPAPPSPSVLSIPHPVRTPSAPPSPRIASQIPRVESATPPPLLDPPSHSHSNSHSQHPQHTTDDAKRIPTSQLMTVLSGVYGMRKDDHAKCINLIPDQCLTLIFRKRTMWLQADSVAEKDEWLRACAWLKERVEEREAQAAERRPSERAKRNAALSSVPPNMTAAKKSAFLLRTGHYFTKWDSRSHPGVVPLYINCSSDLSIVKWGHNPTQHPDKKHPAKLQAPANSILDVTFGLNCPIFQTARWSFSIYFAGDKKLHLEVDSQQERDEWVEAFRWLKTSMSKISRVLNVEHVTHLDRDMKWTGDAMERNFQLGGKIGQGGFCEVYRAVHAVTGFEMAVKIYKNVDMNDFKNETKVLKQAHHPNLVGYYGCWGPDSQGRTWVLMDYCDGGSISSIIRKYRKHAEALNPALCHRPAHVPLTTPEGDLIHNPHGFSATTCYMSEQLIAYVLQATIRALMYLHQLGIVHRDVKGGNILLTKKGEVKLSDFGIAAHLPPEALADDGKVKEQKREVGKIAGSPHFMAPEALRGYPVHKLHDIWSVGITALELSYYGKPPYHDLPYHKVALQVCRNPAPRLEGEWSPLYKDFVSKCLVKDIKERWDGAALLEHPFITSIDHAKCQLELQQFLQAGPPLPSSASSPAAGPQSPQQRVASPHQQPRQIQPSPIKPVIHRQPSPAPIQRSPSPAPQAQAQAQAQAQVQLGQPHHQHQASIGRPPVLARPPTSPESSQPPVIRPLLIQSASSPATTIPEPMVSPSNRAVRRQPTDFAPPPQTTTSTQAQPIAAPVSTRPTSSSSVINRTPGTPTSVPAHSPPSLIKKLSIALPTSKPVSVASPPTSSGSISSGRAPNMHSHKKSIVGAMVLNGQLLDDVVPAMHRPRSHSLGSVSTKSNVAVVLETTRGMKRVNSESRLDVKAKSENQDEDDDDDDEEVEQDAPMTERDASTQGTVVQPRVHDGDEERITESDSDTEGESGVLELSPHVIRKRTSIEQKENSNGVTKE